jgi:hypothetical protein
LRFCPLDTDQQAYAPQAEMAGAKTQQGTHILVEKLTGLTTR